MDAGYCTYYATTMVAMLRAQDVPARLVTGYTTGQQVAEGEYVVRGLDAHAWVQVYFEGVGWVRFDPTPSGPRETAENARLVEARQNGQTGVDVESSEETATPEPTATPATETSAAAAGGNGTPAASSAAAPDGVVTPSDGSIPGSGATTTTDGGGSPIPDLPPRRTLLVGLIGLVGLVAGARRVGLTDRAYRSLWLRYQGSGRTPDDDVVRAFRRLEYLLEREYRPRRTGETPRTYLRSLSRVGLGDEAIRVGEAYERARYGDGVSRSEADEAVAVVDRLVRASTPVVGRLFG
jgi:hypothetical protein